MPHASCQLLSCQAAWLALKSKRMPLPQNDELANRAYECVSGQEAGLQNWFHAPSHRDWQATQGGAAHTQILCGFWSRNAQRNQLESERQKRIRSWSPWGAERKREEQPQEATIQAALLPQKLLYKRFGLTLSSLGRREVCNTRWTKLEIVLQHLVGVENGNRQGGVVEEGD